MRKEWRYVIALVVLILLLLFIFREDIGLGPVKWNSDLRNNFLNLDTEINKEEQKIISVLRKAANGAAE